jgi:hypothetical protein
VASIKAVVVGVVAPAGAIAAGVLLQQLLVSVWPGVQSHTIFNVSLDSYLGAVAIGCLTFWVGLRIRRSAPGLGMSIAALIFPAIWWLLFQFAVYPPAASLNALRIVYTAIAVAPLVGIGLAYALPSNNRWRGP